MPTKSSIKPYIFWVSFMWQQRFWYFPHKWLANWYMSRRPIASQNPMSNHGYPYPLSRKVKLSNQIPGIENQGATNLAKCQVVGTPVAKSWCLLRSADNATYVAQCSHTHTHTHAIHTYTHTRTHTHTHMSRRKRKVTLDNKSAEQQLANLWSGCEKISHISTTKSACCATKIVRVPSFHTCHQLQQQW